MHYHLIISTQRDIPWQYAQLVHALEHFIQLFWKYNSDLIWMNVSNVKHRSILHLHIFFSLHLSQENIGAFGGDRTNVTLMGHGKGGIFVNFLMISSAVPTGKSNLLPVDILHRKMDNFFLFTSGSRSKHSGVILFLQNKYSCS